MEINNNSKERENTMKGLFTRLEVDGEERNCCNGEGCHCCSEDYFEESECRCCCSGECHEISEVTMEPFEDLDGFEPLEDYADLSDIGNLGGLDGMEEFEDSGDFPFEDEEGNPII